MYDIAPDQQQVVWKIRGKQKGRSRKSVWTLDPPTVRCNFINALFRQMLIQFGFLCQRHGTDQNLRPLATMVALRFVGVQGFQRGPQQPLKTTQSAERCSFFRRVSTCSETLLLKIEKHLWQSSRHCSCRCYGSMGVLVWEHVSAKKGSRFTCSWGWRLPTRALSFQHWHWWKRSEMRSEGQNCGDVFRQSDFNRAVLRNW